MAEYDEWNRKGSSLSDVTAKKEYKVDRDFIIQGIEAGKNTFRGPIWRNPYIRILRRQLEEYIAAEYIAAEYIAAELGAEYLEKAKGKKELLKIKSEIAQNEMRLSELLIRKAELEKKIIGEQPFIREA